MDKRKSRRISFGIYSDSLKHIPTFTVLVFTLLISVSSRSQFTLRYKTLEEQPIGTVIADDVIQEVALRHGYSNETARTLTLSIVDGWTDFISTGSEYWQRNTLVVKESLDRELICPTSRSLTDGKDCVISVDIAVHPVQYFKIIRIEVVIVDINDNSPVYGQAEFHQSIPESITPGTYIRLPAAVDQDGPLYSISGYELESAHPTDHPFRLVWNMTSSGNLYEHDDVRLQLIGALDRESVDRYHVTVRAYDGDTLESRKSAVLRVVIDVSDVNDNSPRFERDTYDVTLPDNYVGGLVIARVVATDSDEERNGIVRYRMSLRSQALTGELFNVHHVTGDVTLVRGFDENTLLSNAEHKLVVIATDQGDNPLPTSVVVTIRVPERLRQTNRSRIKGKDISTQRRALMINVETLNGNSLTSNVVENNPPGTFLAHITVATDTMGSNDDDDDDDDAEDFTCSISAHTCTSEQRSTAGAFSILPLYGQRDFKLIASTSLDRESCSSYDVIITCKVTSHMTSSAVVKVMVDDVDDNAPVFERGVYDCQVRENNKVGDVIAVVQARDDDVTTQEPRTRLERASGDSRHRPGAFRRVEHRYSRTVTHTSKDQNISNTHRRRPHAVFPRVSQRNVAEKSHKIGYRRDYRVRRSKNSRQDVPKLTAALYYKLDYEASKYFHINSRTGEISAVISFDREVRSRYEFYVTAVTIFHETSQINSDGFLLSDESLRDFSGNGNTSARCLVRVTILDEDDETAEFVRSWYRFSVSESVGSGTEIGSVKAVDNDLPPNAQFLYQLFTGDGSDVSQFAIDPDSGIIYTRHQLDRETTSHYTLKVKAVSVTSSLKSTSGQDDDSVLVFVRIIDANDNPPVFGYPSPDGGSVWRLSTGSSRDAVALSARDPDEGDNARISYRLISGSDDMNLFHVEETRGVLTWTDISQRRTSQSNLASDTISSRTRSSSSSLPHSSAHSTPVISPSQSLAGSSPVNRSLCPILVTVRADDHPVSDPALSTTAVLFVLPRGCNWSPSSRARSSDVSNTSFDSGAETLTKFHILIIAGAVGMCIVLSVLLGVSVCLCRYCSKSSSSTDLSGKDETIIRETELMTQQENNNDDNGKDDNGNDDVGDDDGSEKQEAFLMLDKLCRDGENDKEREIVLYVKDPAGLRAPEPVARFQLQCHPVPECRRSSRLYSSRRSHRAESDESGLFRSDRDTDSGYLDVSSV